MNRIIIEVSGGIIQDVIADERVLITVVDWDTEGTDPEELHTIKQNAWCDHDREAYIYELDDHTDSERIDIFTAGLDL